MIRVDGDMKRINMPRWRTKKCRRMVYDIMNDKQRKALREFFETTFLRKFPSWRASASRLHQNRGAGAVFRTVPSVIMSLDAICSHRRFFRDLCRLPRGLCWSPAPPARASPRRSRAWSTTATNRPDHIITIEDPIGSCNESKRCR